MSNKKMNHLEYQNKIRNYTDSSLKYIIFDCQAAIQAMPENPNNSYYADEICYCSMELRKRGF